MDHQKPVQIRSDVRRAAVPANRRAKPVSTDDLYVVGNSNYRLLVSDGKDYASVVDLGFGSQSEKRGIAPSRSFGEAGLNGRIVASTLSTQQLDSGFLLQGFDYLAVMTSRGCFDFSGSDILRTRSFPRSLRHTDSFAAIANDFVDLVGFIELSREY
ncbi:hypothetical protein QN357_11230 [Cryobacterium sp. RTC2.1]|uniref:hypothetical protein n=1 Tax=Cryobacterium sp. RTC2.1 TaxID=3048634 RepID=UPI002B2341F8|nr:hypothetical protein [Cryobacterium sp. RTC2.1]MEB0003499.1 hypothetical protein [Cryobacterium sp. RTC2.1]